MFRLNRVKTLQNRFFDQRVGQPLELEDGHPPGLGSAALFAVSFIVIAMIMWAAIAEVREVAVAKGELMPTGNIQAVQHFEGGIVDAVLVKAGNQVKMGDPILRLKPKQVSSDVDQLRGRMAWLELDEARLAAEQSGKKPDFRAQLKNYPEFVSHQQAIYAANLEERAKTFSALDQRIAALNAEIAALTNEIAKLQAENDTYGEIFDMQYKLVQKGQTSRRNFLEVKASFQRTSTALATAEVRLAESKKDLAAATGEKKTSVAKTQKDIADQRAKNVEQRLELTYQLDKLSDRFERLLVRAPVDGFVKDVLPKGAGAVIQPGQLIAEIVPKGQDLVAEVKIQPRDIGHIESGDIAELEITTYDVNVRGKIKGKVTRVSASSFQGTDGEPYFRSEISFDLAAQDDPISDARLIPGMLVEAHIITGTKSILRYLMKPIYRSFDRAFTER